MSILSGPEIRKRVEAGEIRIDPFDPELVNPASYDLRLGHQVCVYQFQKNCYHLYNPLLDSRVENPSEIYEISNEGIAIHPRRIYLLHSVEVICAPDLVAVVDGKSSLGRLGLVVHATAGYVDPGFQGQVTFEVAVLGPSVRIYPGMRIAQVRFQTIEGEVESYQWRGNYTGVAARGPVPSRSWKQFER